MTDMMSAASNDEFESASWLEGAPDHFAGQKLVVVGGSSGMGRQTAADGSAYGITADLADRTQVERVRRQLADEHADAALLVNAAGLFIPKPFVGGVTAGRN